MSRHPRLDRAVLSPTGRRRASWLRLDLGLFIGAAGLSIVGVVLVWSATRQTHGSGLALKQLVSVAIGMADWTLVSTPTFSSAFCIANAFMTVASIPM